MKKKIVVEETWCDLCKNTRATLKCKVCGKDVCSDCARYLCKYNPPPMLSRSSSPWVQTESYPSRPTYEPVVNETLCADCCEAFKMTIAVTAGQDKVDPEKVKEEILRKQRKEYTPPDGQPTSMYS